MKFIVIFLLMASQNILLADLSKWVADVDQNYIDRNVRSTHAEDEFKYLIEKFPLDVDSISLKELGDFLDGAVSRAKVDKEKASDGFLGFIYCMKVGINCDDLIRESKSNELLLTYLIAGLMDKSNFEFYKSIKRVDRRRLPEK